MTIIAAPDFGVLEKDVVVEHGGTDAPDAKETDKATEWLNENSAGTGPVPADRLAAQPADPDGEEPELLEGHAGLRARADPPHERERGAAPRHPARRHRCGVQPHSGTDRHAEGRSQHHREGTTSLDFIYMAVVEAPTNPALQNKLARQAIGYAIDYDGIIKNLIGGEAVRPGELPARRRQRLDRGADQGDRLPRGPRQVEAVAGARPGCRTGFKLPACLWQRRDRRRGYQNLAQKIQADLARVGIKAELTPMDQVNMRTHVSRRQARGGADLLEPAGAGEPAVGGGHVNRVARPRALGGAAGCDVRKLVADARRPNAIWRRPRRCGKQYQQTMVDQANHFVLIQPVYQDRGAQDVAGLRLTAAGWMAELDGAKPTS